MQLTGHIDKMQTFLEEGMAHYKLSFDNQQVDMSSLVGQHIELTFNKTIQCANPECKRITPKSYSQGYCFPCARSLARCDLCIMRPETCHYHLGTCREPEWGLSNCFTPHIVYLANSSGIKVGITRKTNTPSRWIDQGAISALPILEVKTRLESGLIEKSLKSFITDKTNWRVMLKNETEPADLVITRASLLGKISSLVDELDAKTLPDDVINIDYPVLKYPTKVVSLNFDKNPVISGVLNGIKGQYLLLESGVLNVRKFSSFHLTLST
ncbi:DUF2797 domain-containing protein [Candidatus Thioglobus sp.]|nr:DUF2797 domain-containing protein [Candidatus Thioglobus sp.]